MPQRTPEEEAWQRANPHGTLWSDVNARRYPAFDYNHERRIIEASFSSGFGVNPVYLIYTAEKTEAWQERWR